MVLSKKKTITIALALADDRMLSRAAASVGAANTRGLSGENGGRSADGAHEVTSFSRLASGVMTIPGLIVLIRAPRVPQRTASAMTRSEFPRFES